MSMSPSSRFRERLPWTQTVFLCVAAIWLALCCNTIQADVTQNSEIVKKIVDDWNRRQQIRGFRYLIGGTWFLPKGWLNHVRPPELSSDDFPSTDATIDVQTEYIVDLERNRSRIERDREQFHADERRYIRIFQIQLFDGQHAQIFYPRTRNREWFDDARGGDWNPDLELEDGGAPAFGREDTPILLAHGMVPGERASNLSPTGTLRRSLNAEMFVVYGRAVRDGQECIVLRSETDRTGAHPSCHEYWVDLQAGSTILRYVRYVGDSETYQIDMWYEDDDMGQGGLARYTMHEGIAGKLVPSREIRVLEYQPEPVFSDTVFYVEPQPGFNVYDWVNDRKYRVGLPGQEDREFAELRRALAHQSRNWMRFVLSCSSLAALVVVGVLLFFHFQKRRMAI
jgi:hypothetical protein